MSKAGNKVLKSRNAQLVLASNSYFSTASTVESKPDDPGPAPPAPIITASSLRSPSRSIFQSWVERMKEGISLVCLCSVPLDSPEQESIDIVDTTNSDSDSKSVESDATPNMLDIFLDDTLSWVATYTPDSQSYDAELTIESTENWHGHVLGLGPSLGDGAEAETEFQEVHVIIDEMLEDIHLHGFYEDSESIDVNNIQWNPSTRIAPLHSTIAVVNKYRESTFEPSERSLWTVEEEEEQGEDDIIYAK